MMTKPKKPSLWFELICYASVSPLEPSRRFHLLLQLQYQLQINWFQDKSWEYPWINYD
jgi:hypothetical protein